MVRIEQGECLPVIAVVIGCIAQCTELGSQHKNFRLVVMMVCASQVRGCHLQCDAHRPITNHQLKNAMRVVRSLCASESY
jgi:hypothetical protein